MDIDRIGQSSVEDLMSDELTRANRTLGGVSAVIALKLECPGEALVSDAIVARLRGMLQHLATQALTAASTKTADVRPDQVAIDELADRFRDDKAILSHLYALAMEGHLAERLERRSAIDPVQSPLLRELIGSDRPSTSGLAMEMLASQSRFIQTQRRMNLPMDELPAELFADLLEQVEASLAEFGTSFSASGLSALRARYDEGATRLGLLARVMAVGREAPIVALQIEHAGLALFASGISELTGQPRELAILACHERPAARLALSLRAAGQSEDSIERQLYLLDRSEYDPVGIDAIAPDRAAAMLNGSGVSASHSTGRG